MGVVKVAVIGAGMSGLVAARELQREGHNVVVFEKSDKVGGTWVYDPQVETDLLGLDPDREIVHGSLYASLRTNLPRHVMGFLDYPFLKREGGDPRSFPGHGEVLWFLNSFAKDFGLVELIRFGCNVVRVERVKERENEWTIEWRSTGGIDSWPGLQMHSHNYRTPEPFQDKIVVIIGAGPSAFDISKELSSFAKEVHVSSRASNVQLKMMLDHDRIWHHPMIKCADGDGKVVFLDGSFTYADAIIHCTGYKYHFPFLKTNGVVSVDDNRVGPLYKHVFPPCLAPRLSFVGLPYMAIHSPMSELQSKWIAKILSGKVVLPTKEEMTASVEELYLHMEETGWPKRHTHKIQQDKDKLDYQNWLAAQSGLPPLEKWWEQVYFSVFKIGPSYGAEYRDKLDVDSWLKEAESSF
ncbi:Flavin monooxygenase-like [Dillenia turbinata]|uniref:Flavin-containing monooxygenase n=1 Tax=Dillenia turbinata TaxID=194707 RepID=A0AAN8Z4E7_9MAGN